jgi:hypothetical protein
MNSNRHKEYADVYNSISFVQYKRYFDQLITYAHQYIEKETQTKRSNSNNRRNTITASIILANNGE